MATGNILTRNAGVLAAAGNALVGLLIGIAPALAEEGGVDYERQIKPLLAEKCIACHGPVRQEAGLRLDAAVLVRRGGDSGAVVDVALPVESLLIERVAAESEDDRMPPAGEGEALTREQIDLLRTWIAADMPAPADESFLESPQDHWAYQPIRRPEVPTVSPEDVSHPIDAFVLSKCRQQGLLPLPAADRRTWLRRVYLDVIGLPPTVQQQRQFLDDHSSDAYEKVVDSLLANPHYSERWARHWMDIWRYSDWDGYKQELRGSQRHIWRWREWIIASLQQDKGYDRMIFEMLAGDEIAPEDPETLAATGFLARNFHKSNRNIWLDATVEHTAKAFLAMTLDCARCHDHKFDPLSQAEYYRFRAIFEPHQVRTDHIPGQLDIQADGLPRAYDADLSAETYLLIRGDEKQPDKDHPMLPSVPEVLDLPLAIEPVELSPLAAVPALRPFVQQQRLAVAQQRWQEKQKSLDTLIKQQELDASAVDPSQVATAEQDAMIAAAELHAWEKRLAADAAKHLGSAGEADFAALAKEAARAERHHSRLVACRSVGEKQQALQAAEASDEADKAKRTAAIEKARKELQAAEKSLADAKEAEQKDDVAYTATCDVYPQQSTGRRTALAQWLVSPENPLTARVAVNHIWLRHFGRPLVENVFDFGLRSPRPEHAELLDYLAAELIDHDWSMQHLHRLILTSETYRRSGNADVAVMTINKEIDPDNKLLWRYSPRRLDAEVVRDSLIHVAGQLDRQFGGPDLPYSEGESRLRRSVYFQHAYEKQMLMLTLFDAPSPNECYRRSASVVPQQALVLANSNLSWTLARQLARDIDAAEDVADDGDFIERVFERILTRPPSAAEQAVCREFLSEQRKLLASPDGLTRFPAGGEPRVRAADDAKQRSRENLVHAIFNHNDFVTVR